MALTTKIKKEFSNFFFRKERNYKVAFYVSLYVSVIFSFLFSYHFFDEIEKGFQAIIYQLGYKVPEDSGLVTVVKKDSLSSNLLDVDCNRRDLHASLIRLLGSRQKKDRMRYKSRTQNYELLALKIGIFKNIKDQYPISISYNEWSGFLDKSEEKNNKFVKTFNQEKWDSSSKILRDYYKKDANKDKEGFFSFLKVNGSTWKPKGQNLFKVLAGGNNYLLFPTFCIDWKSEETKKAVNDLINNNFDEVEFKRKISSSIDLKSQKNEQSVEEIIRRWGYFFENLLYAQIEYEIKLFPSSKNKYENTLFSLSIKLKTLGRDTSYWVEPASVIGLDFVFQGEKDTNPEWDKSLEDSLNNCQSKVVLAAKAGEEYFEDEAARDVESLKEALEEKYEENNNLEEEKAKFVNQDITSIKSESVLIKPLGRFYESNNNVDYAMIDMGADKKSYIYQAPIIIKVSERIRDEGKETFTRKVSIKPSFALKIALEHLDFVNENVFPKELKENKEKLNNLKEDSKDYKTIKKELEHKIAELEKKIANAKPGYVETQKKVFEEIREDFINGSFKGNLKIKDLELPINDKGYLYINYAGSTRKGKRKDINKPAIESVSLFEVLEENVLKAYLKKNPDNIELNPEYAHRRIFGGKNKNKGNKVYIVGPFEAEDFDFYPTPVSYYISSDWVISKQHLMGVEIHANIISNILKRNFLRHPTPLHCYICIFACSIFSALIFEMVSPFVGAFLAFLFIFLCFGYSYISYNNLGQVFYVVPIIVAIFSIWVVNTLINYVKQRIKANTTKSMFSRFVSKDVVQYMLDNPDMVKPGGTKTELTIFFSDVAGFTTISEGLSPEDLVILLNEYLGAMTDLLFEYGGTLDKFIGDAVMAFWNFPRKQEDHAVRAVLCAIAMQKKIKELQLDWAKRGFPKVAARCGINTQDVVVGYMGSQKAQMNFTCMGDGVNLASRLEGANKEYGTMMMVSDNTYQRVKHAVRGRFLDFLAVKGKKEPVKVHELVCKIGDEPEGWFEKTALYDKAIQLHLERKWDEAIATFEEVLKLDPNDGPSKTYITRCNEYKVNPPPEGWDGRYILTHK